MKIAIGLSGGVDSSVAAHLLKSKGHEVIGVFMRFWHEDNLVDKTENEIADNHLDWIIGKEIG